MHQGMTVTYGENKGDIIRAYYKDLVRADNADAWEGNDDD